MLERGELQVRFEEGTFYAPSANLPIATAYSPGLEVALENLTKYKDEDFYAELQSVLTALEYLPKRTETNPKREVAERAKEKEIIKHQLERGCAPGSAVLQQAIKKPLHGSRATRAVSISSTNC